jgi:hypothetical protein
VIIPIICITYVISHLFSTPRIERYWGSSIFLLNMCKWHFQAIFETFINIHTFKGSFSCTSKFEIFFISVYEALMVFSSIIKNGKIESVSRPSSEFWCLNNKTIKELMSFAKCETGKMSCNYIEAIHSLRHMLRLI